MKSDLNPACVIEKKCQKNIEIFAPFHTCMPSHNSYYIYNVHLLIYKHICLAVDELHDILDMSVMIRVCMCNLSWCCYLLRLRQRPSVCVYMFEMVVY